MDHAIDLHVRAPFLFSQAAAAVLPDGGRIITIGSNLADRTPYPGVALYAATKAAVVGMTRGLARELGPYGIRVNCVCPGTTATPLVEELVARAPDPAAARRQWESIRPMNRLGTTNEIASAILYLASQEAGYATGAVLAVDGGYTAQ